ncbi:unnamed protein product [Mytilus edulis]|uniref:MADF domain-containing protein n=1 Tax=Mytilus edulis TaxID=6550 RepID=A0A8S3SVJ4_MYTED|nr:unnamed protein product [Mytilus edulis]
MASKKTQPGFDREKLIHLVRDTECLWDPSTKEYMDSDITQSEWQRISEEMGISGADCKAKFKNLKDTYRRKKKDEKDIKSGSKGSNSKKWPFYEFLAFLDPVVVPVDSCTNLENSTSEEEGNELEVENVSVPPVKKMKNTARKNIDTQFVEFLKDSSKTLHESISQGNQKELDEEGHYGQTVAANLRRLSPQQKARAKILINQALYDVEFNTPYREVLSSRNVNNQYQKVDENEPTTYFLMN